MHRSNNTRVCTAELPSYWQPVLRRLKSDDTRNGSDWTLAQLLFAIRDMPYERPVGQSVGARECVTQWCGTCSAKHLAAYELLDTLGLSPTIWLACYRMDFDRPYYSGRLRQHVGALTIYDVHNFLTCELHGKRCVIDVTFPVRLGKLGFPVTHDWSEGQDFVLCCEPEERREMRVVADTDRLKREWLHTLNPGEASPLREQAIGELMFAAKAESKYLESK